MLEAIQDRRVREQIHDRVEGRPLKSLLFLS